jgi:transposase
VVGPFLAAWKAKHPSASGHQGRYDLREILNSIFYQNRTGCQWAYLPHDLPPKSATYYFALWRDDGTDQAMTVLPHAGASCVRWPTPVVVAWWPGGG